MVETYQYFDITGGKETSRSLTSASVPVTVHLLHHGHNISGPQAQLSFTHCVCRTNSWSWASYTSSRHVSNFLKQIIL